MARRSALIAGVLLAVLLMHAVVLEWVARQALGQPAMQQMAAPMFTRLLQPEAPPPVVAKTVEVPKPRQPPAIRTVEASVPPAATVTAAAPETKPEPQPEPELQPPPPPEPKVEVAASEPEMPTPTAVVTPDADPTAQVQPTASGTVPATDTVTVTLDGWPIDTRLTYRVGGYYRGELHGTARVEWLRDGERYQTRVDIDLGLVSMVMTSQGLVRDKELAPSAYEETRIGKRRSVQINDKVVLSDGSQVPKPEGVQDTASQFVELSHRFSSGQLQLEVGKAISFWMARPGGVDYWTYDVVEKEMLRTPQLGLVEAFHLKPRPTENPRGNITAEMWFAPMLKYLPVRIKVNAGDASLDLLVDKIEQR